MISNHKLCTCLNNLIYFLLLFVFFPGNNGNTPRDSQQGTLRPFKSYSDVTIFHYTVPRQISKATWQFAAIGDNEICPSRKVDIFLQWGSYPIISAENSKFPNNTFYSRDNWYNVSTITTFESKITAMIPVFGPKYGDWFVGAYLLPWDEKIKPKGLGHKCQYTLGAVAMWTPVYNIKDISIEHKISMITSSSTTYYKFYIPSRTQNFYVYISNCNFTVRSLQSNDDYCIKAVAIQAHSLPVFDQNNSSKMTNISTLNSYEFSEFSPFVDDYYYLMITSDSIIEFNIEINVKECPIGATKVHFPNIFQQGLYIPYDIYDQNYCVPRYQLTRVKHLQKFSVTYLLQGKEDLTSWISLTDYHPVIIQFEILPLIDIGGTLEVNLHLEMNKLLTKQTVKIFICFQRARVPSIKNGTINCHNNKIFMNELTVNQNNITLLVPYPQPSMWYIAMQAKCYAKNRLTICEMEEILTSVDIHIQQCLFSGNQSCGNYGTCEKIHKDFLSYGVCNCLNGYKGWGCTDGTDVSFLEFHVQTILLILSNVFFFPSIYFGLIRKFYVETLVYSLTMLFSILYHTCDQNIMAYCFIKYEILQYFDFFSSLVAFWVTLVTIANLPQQIISVTHIFGVFVIAFVVQYDRMSLSCIMTPLFLGITILIGSFIYHYSNSKNFHKPKNIRKILIGLSMVGVGLFFFCFLETERNYKYVHSAWHVIIATSLIFLLPDKRI